MTQKMMKEAGSREARRDDDGRVIIEARPDETSLRSLLAERHTRTNDTKNNIRASSLYIRKS